MDSRFRIMRSWSIRGKLLLLLSIIFLPAFGIIVTSGLSHRRDEIQKAENSALLLVQSLAAQQEQIATSTKVMLSTLAQFPEVWSLDSDACNVIFSEMHNRYPFYSVELFDLILMDVQMPEMDGLKATGAIREKGFDKIPIIAMTANAMKSDRENCLDAGMNDYISKPIRRENVLEVIQKWI
jgi:CheY-like chemotaxis protein